MNIIYHKSDRKCQDLSKYYTCTILVFSVVFIKIADAKGQLISKSRLASNIRPKNERTNLFGLLFYSSQQTNQIRPFVFGENLRCANLVLKLTDL